MELLKKFFVALNVLLRVCFLCWTANRRNLDKCTKIAVEITEHVFFYFQIFHMLLQKRILMRPHIAIVSLFIVPLCAMMNWAQADGLAIALHGNDRGAVACVACHGAHGEGMPESGFPRLTGLNAAYLQAQLEAFANGQRSNAMMPAIAQALSQDERIAVANYYANLNDSAILPRPIAALNSAGERLAVQGRWSQSLPACMQCHGELGVGAGSNFPALAGQSSLYIENQLRAWQQGTRAAGPLGLMTVVASKLSEADIHDVAAYFSALPVSAPSRRSRP